MLDTPELVRLVANKSIVSEKRGRGRKGYGRCPAMRLLVYAQLKGIHRDKNLEKFLQKKSWNCNSTRTGRNSRPDDDRPMETEIRRGRETCFRKSFEHRTEFLEILCPSERNHTFRAEFPFFYLDKFSISESVELWWWFEGISFSFTIFINVAS